MLIETLHHVSLTVTDLDLSRAFYRDVIGLAEIARPPFPFPGAWFAIGGAQHLHLIVHPACTLRTGKPLDSRDNHFALRVPSFQEAVAHLRALGYSETADPLDPLHMSVSPYATAGFPQIAICDPDRHVIEINAAALDRE